MSFLDPQVLFDHRLELYQTENSELSAHSGIKPVVSQTESLRFTSTMNKLIKVENYVEKLEFFMSLLAACLLLFVVLIFGYFTNPWYANLMVLLASCAVLGVGWLIYNKLLQKQSSLHTKVGVRSWYTSTSAQLAYTDWTLAQNMFTEEEEKENFQKASVVFDVVGLLRDADNFVTGVAHELGSSDVLTSSGLLSKLDAVGERVKIFYHFCALAYVCKTIGPDSTKDGIFTWLKEQSIILTQQLQKMS